MATTPVNLVSGIVDQTPDPAQVNYHIKTVRNNAKGRIEIQTSRDSGISYQQILPEPTSATPIGSVLTLTSAGVEWVMPVAPEVPAINPYTYISFNFPGSPQPSRVFSGFTSPAIPVQCIGMQLELFSPSSVVVSVDIVNVNSTPQGKTGSLAPAAFYSQTNFRSPLVMQPNTSWQLIVLNTGTSDQLGDTLSGRLILLPI